MVLTVLFILFKYDGMKAHLVLFLNLFSKKKLLFTNKGEVNEKGSSP
jgi:hypothetical protein